MSNLSITSSPSGKMKASEVAAAFDDLTIRPIHAY
jgi:hypothetical protein